MTAKRKNGRYRDTNEFLGMVARVVAVSGSRVADADVDSLGHLLHLQDLVAEAIVVAVAGLRESGVTWEEIGGAAGTTRQAALMRWGPKIG